MDLYLADIHFYNPDCSELLGKTPDYFQHASRGVMEAVRYSKVIIRHLLIPGHFHCCFVPIADWLRENLPEVPVHLLGNYHDTDGCQLSEKEFNRARQYAVKIGLQLYSSEHVNSHPLKREKKLNIPDEEIADNEETEDDEQLNRAVEILIK